MQQIITARALLTDSGNVEFPVITVDDEGAIVDISSNARALANERTVLAAAFLDIHVHGSTGVDVMNAGPAEMQKLHRFLAQHGVAHYLPTTVTAPLDLTFRALEALAGIIEGSGSDDGATPLGIHIEGPFLSHAKRGMHPEAYLQPPSIELFERLQQVARGHIKLMTIAPEPEAMPGRSLAGPSSSPALELIKYASERGVRCSIGHSNATFSQAIAAINAGAVSATHTFNAMRPFDHREPGILGVVLDNEQLFADLICDGVHVSPAAVRLWWKAKGPERSILITDGLAAAGLGDGNYKIGATELSVYQGRALVADDLAQGKETLAGSLLTMDDSVSNLRRYAAASLSAAVRTASHNPAAMLGHPTLTQLAPGSPANLTRFDEHGNLVATYLRRKQVPLDTYT